MPLTSRETKPLPCRRAVTVLAGTLLLVAAHASAQAEDQPAVSCPARAPPAGDRATHALNSVAVKIGSPDGKLGSIESVTTLDASGKHGKDIYPLAGTDPLFLRCEYPGAKTIARPIPAKVKECEFDYHYINDYDTVADRAFCR